MDWPALRRNNGGLCWSRWWVYEVCARRAARGRFRILYQVDTRARLVSVLLVGKRAAGQDADIYALAQKLLTTLRRGGKKERL